MCDLLKKPKHIVIICDDIVITNMQVDTFFIWDKPINYWINYLRGIANLLIQPIDIYLVKCLIKTT